MTARAAGRWLRALGIAGGAIVILVAAGALVAGSVVTRPRRADIGSPPADLPAESVSFITTTGDTLRGWYAPGRPGRGAVVLMTGIHDDRRSMIGRARFLTRAGYAVLLFDFHGEGESTERRITFGATEAVDAAAAVAFLKSRTPSERLGAIGVSMGGAAALLGAKPLDVDALVLESVYPTIDAAVRDRLTKYLGPLGAPLAPIFLAQLRPRFGLDATALRPIDRIGAVRAPILLMAGTADRDTRISEARALFDRASEPKSFWAVPGAGHEDLLSYRPAEYERRVLAFFATTLSR
ncbi:MAG TPA: alpha/beta hydrolase [Gemmatimonadaceae bacterium]|nr:alpha/beta hydrolase [Gemmatimonadaceae bacterium]